MHQWPRLCGPHEELHGNKLDCEFSKVNFHEPTRITIIRFTVILAVFQQITIAYDRVALVLN